MTKELEISIDSILGGISPSLGFGGEGQYLAGIAVDPEFPATDSAVVPSGWIRPTAMEKFSSTEIDSPPLWIQTNPKDTNVYTYLVNGKFVSYNSSLASPSSIGTPTNGNGGGMVYYDNYYWLFTTTNVTRYGPLTSSPALINSSWTAGSFTGTSGGLGLTALTNTTYPAIRGVTMPNHVAHRHTDDAVYFCDVHAGGYGILNKIKTTKTTVEGDTNNGSAYNVLDFDAGVYPTTVCSYQESLAVALIEGVSTTVRQKNAKISFWDTTSDSFSLITDDEFPDPLITALLNVNGVLYVASGSATGGCRISRYVGGYTHETIWYNQDAFPPLQGAFADLLNRVVFGSATTYPEASASVFGIGSMDGKLSSGVHNILKTTSTGTTPYVTAVCYAQNSALPRLAPIVGWKDGTTAGAIDKLSSTYGVWVIRFGAFKIGEYFEIYQVDIPLGAAVAANMTVIPKIYVDSETANTALRTINATNFATSDKFVSIMTRVIGKSDFVLELRGTGTVLLPIAFPIKIKLRTIR